MPKPFKATGNLKRDTQYPVFPMFLSILIADKKTKNSRRRIPERYPTIRKTQKVQKAKGNLKCWMVSRVNRGFWRPLMWQDCSLTAVQRKIVFVELGTVMIAWIWHIWINAMVSVPMAQAPPMAGAKELLYSLVLIHEFTSLFSPKVIFAGSLRKAFLQKHAFVDTS